MNTYPRVYLTYHADGEVGIGTPKDASAPLGEPVEHLRVSHTSKGRQMNRSLRQAAQQALEAMLAFPDDISDEMFEAIRALKERLAQPEQEPVAFRNKETGEFCTGGFMQILVLLTKQSRRTLRHCEMHLPSPDPRQARCPAFACRKPSP